MQGPDRPSSQNSIQQQVSTKELEIRPPLQMIRPKRMESDNLKDLVNDQTSPFAQMSQTMSPMNKYMEGQTSNKTIKLDTSTEDYVKEMARTFVSSSDPNSPVNVNLQEVMLFQDSNQAGEPCTCDNNPVTLTNRKMLEFQSESGLHGSELKGWDVPDMPAKNINITLQSVVGSSTLDGQTDSTQSNFMGQMMPHQGAIRIEHSPSFSKIYSRKMQDIMHNHKRTQQTSIQAQTI